MPNSDIATVISRYPTKREYLPVFGRNECNEAFSNRGKGVVAALTKTV